ncbi:MAG TPA: nucleotidyl transferase AbiEii/AbiGii toxin family protein, partial [Pseudonocardiaceae bacterium]
MPGCTRTYHDAQPSSRTKDLVDLILITELADLDAVALRRAIETTFAVRGTHPMPGTLPAPPPEWTTPFTELADTVKILTDLTGAHSTAAELLDPILG